MISRCRRLMTIVGVWMSTPIAFGIVIAYAAAWLVFDRESFNWNAVAMLATWMMTLFIQRAEHRDTQAIQAKLDELLRAHSDARDELMHLDQREPEEVEAHRKNTLRGLSKRPSAADAP
jgi:low affinity Fe/Cu permease